MNRNIKNLFGKFTFSPWQLFKDSLVIETFGSFQNCFKFKAFERKKIIDEANKRFKSELDIKQILKKIRNANDMLSTLLTARDRNIIKITKSRVIDPEEVLGAKNQLVPMITISD